MERTLKCADHEMETRGIHLHGLYTESSMGVFICLRTREQAVPAKPPCFAFYFIVMLHRTCSEVQKLARAAGTEVIVAL